MLCKLNQYCKYMVHCQVTPDQWMNRLQNPPVMPKDEAPLVIWGNMADTVEIDPKSRKARCTGANIKSISALQLDYDDGGVTIEQFEHDMSEWKYILYTSSGYGLKPGIRFRVILPLAEPMLYQHYNPLLREHLEQHFRGADESCFVWGHWQILPVLRQQGQPYIWKQHDGELFDLFSQQFCGMVADKWSEQESQRLLKAEEERKQRMQNSTEAAEAARIAGAIRYAQGKIDEATEGTRNRTLWSTLSWLHGKDVPEWDARGLNVPFDMQREFDGMVRRIWM